MATRAANAYILNVPTARREVLLDALVSDPGVSEPVPDFTHSKSHPLICFVSFEDAAITHVAKGRAGLRAGSRLRRLHLEDLTPLSTAIRHDAVPEKIPQRFEVHVARRLEEGGLLPPRSFDAFYRVGARAAARIKRASRPLQQAPHSAARRSGPSPRPR